MSENEVEITAAEAADRIVAGGQLTAAEALALLRTAPRSELHAAAHRVTEACVPKKFDFCAIVNARSGRCSENCKWCAQSAHWQTGCENWNWIGTEACVKAARAAEQNGAARFGIVISGRGPSPADVEAICAAIRELKAKTRIHLCASLGLLDRAALQKLRTAGLERIHCNLETAPSFFGTLCTTHTPEEKLATLRAAKELGYQICCGGILGLGETDEQLVEFGMILREVDPDSIPVNILHPIPGTPLAKQGILDPERVIDAVAILRLINPRTPLRFAGGRRDMSDETAARAIDVGISAGIAGPLLTTPGGDYDDDRHLAVQAGYDVTPDRRSSCAEDDFENKKEEES